MKKRLIAGLVATLFATTLFADGPIRRTIVIKDGKVVSSDGGLFELNDGLLTGKRAFLGVSLVDISPPLREHFGAAKENGVLIESVEDGSPAAKAGIRVGDVVVAVDGKDVHWSADIRHALADKKEGDSVRIDLIRNRARQTVLASLVEREGPRVFVPRDLEVMGRKIGAAFEGPEWKARIERFGDCDDLQSRIKDLEGRLKELEKKLQK